ncbi:MAG: SDR family NAD(P)-dependent oxidoreductase [Dehalococcoidia bacterium]|jgi:NAD(P)-dependent dehydrogenase (short-subunit alcohol dehydrogenase family)
MLLENKTAIVTGGANGIGRGISLLFAEEGCSIAIADLNEEAANETLKEIAKRGSDGIFVKCDHTKSDQVNNMVEKVIAKYGKIDILVNNAGWFGQFTPIADLTEEEWDRSLDVNLKGVFLCCKAVSPYMMKQRYGKIVNMASLAGLTAGPPNAHYSSAKGGVISLTHDLSSQFAAYGITVNSILPGLIRTGMWDHSVAPGTDVDEHLQKRADEMIPLHRVGMPEDVARVALFFASYLSDYVTGDRLIVGGGLPFHSQVPPLPPLPE